MRADGRRSLRRPLAAQLRRPAPAGSGVPVPALHGHRSRHPIGSGGAGHAHHHGPPAASADRTAALGATALHGRVRGSAHFADGETGAAGAGHVGRLLETHPGHHAQDLLLAHPRPAHGLHHHFRLLSLLRGQGRRTAGPARLQGYSEYLSELFI